MESKIYIKSYNTIVCLIGEKEAVDAIKNDEFLLAYIPSCEILLEEKLDYDCSVFINVSEENYIDIKYPTAEYKYKEFNSREIISLMEFMLERARQEKGVLCIHGACSLINNKAFITWGGATGMGKSNLALELSEQEDAEFYSDEKILIDLNTFSVVGGINKLYLHTSYWKEKFGEKEYVDIISNDTKGNDLSSYPIKAFLYPCIVEGALKVIVEQWENSKFEWHLWEESCRKIRATSRRFFNYTEPAQSLDNTELSKKRLTFIKNITKSVACYYVSGDVRSVTKKILSKV